MKLAFVFPGQGSQSIGMLTGLAAHFPAVTETFSEASDSLGFDLWNMVSEGSKETLNQTINTQPAMLAAGVACWRVWQQQGGAAPSVMAGHSLGEYSALVCAGALHFEDAIKLVAERGRLMQEAVPVGQGAMAAILGLEDEQVRSVCNSAADGGVVEAVNFNAPGQVVIAGSTDAVERATALAKEAGAKRALPLPVSVPSHSSLMREAAERFAEAMTPITINPPEIPVINNVDVSAEIEPDSVRGSLIRQLYNPVRWVETVQEMKSAGVDTLIECGPGKVLAGLNKRIDRQMKAAPLFDPASLEAAIALTRQEEE
ncbi:MAG: ACP S-malonyltransferase [Gammaproteobacteria bacterium]|jgi:[acyl-carrier-protein] S-malonyltransferase|nr:ACP S-malonyltransferase [Gammaproteobacteria bacterium]MBT3488120.1 ACP S-malonyltransferase [Gammaproteobacteria bacterium]MBT3717859.1 ACP S-malonyltransferase [Gammaproteobacteria bacterium]MBT3845363.1 ACP S-malonyltransferase [Gammaproteobacteria bacterium]MBT3894415.1 ACP S-malonyltransferase [Gammaproteobacteria bacterium]